MDNPNVDIHRMLKLLSQFTKQNLGNFQNTLNVISRLEKDLVSKSKDLILVGLKFNENWGMYMNNSVIIQNALYLLKHSTNLHKT